MDADESPANTPPESVQHIGGSFHLQNRMVVKDDVEINVVTQQQNALNRKEIRVNVNQPPDMAPEIQNIRLVTPQQEPTTKSRANRDMDCQVISDTASGIADLNQKYVKLFFPFYFPLHKSSFLSFFRVVY